MRRALSTILLLVFSLPLISPLFALAAESGVNLPACCRRNGAHHCAGMMRSPTSSGSGFAASAIPQQCPAYPAVVTPVRHGDLALHTTALIFAGAVSHPATRPQVQARARVALDISRQKRGPPTELL